MTYLSKFFQFNLLLVLVYLTFLPCQQVLAASSFSVTPLFIDQMAEGRDIFTKDIVLKNLTGKPARIYASVNEVNVDDNTRILDFVPASMGDRSVSITSWVEISRSRQELEPNGELTIPLKIKVNPKAKPGVYYAYIGFASGANRDEIENKIKAGDGEGTILKVTVADNTKEQISLVSFRADRFSYNDTDSKINLILENTGDVPLAPNGEIIIYNTKGEELNSIVVNEEGAIIEPGARVEVSKSIPFVNNLGRNKAYLSINYGVKNQASVFDTTFYYSIPWYFIVAFFVVLLVLLIITTLVIKKLFVNNSDSLEQGVYELPLFVKQSHDHDEYHHDLNLKNDRKTD